MIKEKFDLSGKNVLITGGGRGIGRAMALAMAEYGANVAVTSRKQEQLDEVCGEVEKLGVRALAISGHVGKSEDVSRVVKTVADEFGGVDVMINNAATNPAFGPAMFCDDKLFDKIMEVNLKGPFMYTKAVQPLMAAKKSGSIINIISTAAISPAPMLGVYSVSKSGLLGMTKMFARELGSFGIRVNAIAPGLIKTDFSKALWSTDDVLNKVLETQPINRIGESDDPAGLAVFLASEASSFITGSVFVCDGGALV